MNISRSRPHTNGLLRLWQRLQISRAMRLYAEIERDAERMRLKKAKADRLVRDNSLAPCPLFDRLESRR